MRAVLALSILLFSCNALSQYVCSTEQLSERFKPIIPAKIVKAGWYTNNFSGDTPQAAINAYLATKPGYGVCNCRMIGTDNMQCDVNVPSLGCIADGSIGAVRVVEAVSCPPAYSASDNRCISPAVRIEDTLDAQYGDYRTRNADGTTREYQDFNGDLWTVESFDAKGRPSVIRNPDGSATMLMWTRMNVYTRDTDGHLTRYHNWINGKPNAVETTGVGYVVLGWDQDRVSVEHIETSGAGVLIGIDRIRAPLRSQTQSIAKSLAGSTVGITAAPAAPLYLVIDYAVTPGLPLIAVGAAALGGFTLGTYIYPIIEPAVTRVIDACAEAVGPSDEARCIAEADAKLERGVQSCWRHYHAKVYITPPPSDQEYRDAVEQRQACVKAVGERYKREYYACIGKTPPQ